MPTERKHCSNIGERRRLEYEETTMSLGITRLQQARIAQLGMMED